MKLIEKRRFPNGRKEIYILGVKVFSYWSNKLKGIKQRNCNISLDFAKKLIREKNVQFVHPLGIVISDKATIGHNCRIYQNVTIGGKSDESSADVPTLEDNVTIYANSVLVGKIHIGKNAVIGCGSVVTRDVPENEIWAGNPARFIKKRS
ncbi:MAG: serine acetyltransferase [Alphaproteobacteria bacterium]|nr:serine acetyltransferase [Alphaproteobacteria bacterium]